MLIVNLYYITLITKHHVGRLEGKPPAPHHLSSHPLLVNDIYMTLTMSIWQKYCAYYEFFQRDAQKEPDHFYLDSPEVKLVEALADVSV